MFEDNIDHQEHEAVASQVQEEQAAELAFEESCIYRISGGTVDPHNADYWIRISDMRFLVGEALPRQIEEERKAFERALSMIHCNAKTHGPESWVNIAETHKRMHDSRVRRCSQLRGLLASVDLGFFNK